MKRGSRRRFSRLGLLLSVPYLLAGLGVFGYLLYGLQVRPAGPGLVALSVLMVMGMPWSTPVVNALPSSASLPMLLGAVGGCVLLNAILLYVVGAIIGWLFGRIIGGR